MNIYDINKRLGTIKKEKSIVYDQILKQKVLLEKFEEDYTGIIKLTELDKKVFNELSSPTDNASINVKEYITKRNSLAQVNMVERYSELIKNIPISNGSKYYQPYNIKVAIIADEFLYNSFKDVADFIYLTQKNYKELVNKVDLLIVASTWHGIDKGWTGIASANTENRKNILKIIDFYKENKVKTVFYSKEDPVNYDVFIEIAKNCEYIFTTASEVIPDYINDCNNKKVHLLEFGVNPIYHNPVGFKSIEKLNSVFFAGSWMNKYQERCDDGEMILDGVINSGRRLDLVDRNYQLNNPKYFYPEKYLEYLIPSINHEDLMQIHKLYNWSVNLNSVKYSQTMFANRIYELQAIGNLIFSNYSVGVNNKFPGVFLINNASEVPLILNSMDEQSIYEAQIRGINNIMSNYTNFNRFEKFLDTLGIKYISQDKAVLVVTKDKSEKVQNMFDAQTYTNKTLIDISEFNETIKEAYDIIAFFEEKYFYEEYYLENMINAFKYTNTCYITKESFFENGAYIKGTEHNYVSKIDDKYATVFWSKSFTFEELLYEKYDLNNKLGYSIDPFELDKNVFANIENEKPKQYKLSVIIPVYNNGIHLRDKCFNSLRRSTLFGDMEIIMVDDGSTDLGTIREIERLDRKFPNVKSYFFNDGGSGSASRPRNIGHAMATTDIITYLDPDNEAIEDGYYKLYQELMNDELLDLVVGNMPKLDNFKKSNFDYYQSILKVNENEIIKNPKDILVKTNMQAQSIQAVMFRKKLLTDNNLEMVERAGGEDTLFFHELLINSKKTKVINLDIHIYYATVEGSVTNSISSKFYEKFALLESKRVEFLIQNNLMDAYMGKKFSYYYKYWYMKRFNSLKEEDKLKVGDILYNIYKLYLPYGSINDSFILDFINKFKVKDLKGMEKIVEKL